MTTASPPERLIRIGTRGSRLAVLQAEAVRDRLLAAHPGLGVEIVTITTSGDRVQDRALAEIGGKGLFTKEVVEALLAGRVEMAAHSMKDVPTTLPDTTTVDPVLARADPRDALVGRGARSIAALPRGAVVGSASVRRQAQLLHRRPDLKVVLFRGNVLTRLKKLDDGQVSATLLAQAGLDRLGLADRADAVLAPEEMLPAAGQGAIGVEVRAGDAATRALLEPLEHPRTTAELAAERALLATLDGSCRTPIGALARYADDGTLWLRALVAAPDGAGLWRAERRGCAADAAAMGRDAGAELLAAAPASVFAGPR